jgi:UDP-3-O-[3-hydroxymyristoyl] glucosamine N-acyltransferase
VRVRARLETLAREVGGEVRGDATRVVEGVRALESAEPRHLSFVTHPRYREQAKTSRAGALLVGQELAHLDRDLLVCEDPVWALTRVLRLLHPRPEVEPGVHPTVVLDPSCVVEPSAHLGPFVVVGAESRVEARAVLEAGVVIGRGCRVGVGSLLHPGVVLYDGTEVGEGSEIHAGAVLGSDGFRFVEHDGRLEKVPQVGRVVVESEVEIGANSAVDRATVEETRIGAGSKLDNLVQVGHNVQLGPGCVVCGQAGIAGSSRLGRGVVLAGQAGVAEHLALGDGVQVAAQGAALKSVPPGRRVGGTPAQDLGAWRRQVALLRRLEELFRRVKALEKRVYRKEDRR